MKIKNVLGITSIVSVMALGVAFAVSPRGAATVKAYSPEDGYTASADHFVASIHRNNAVRNAYNGDDNEGDSARMSNVVISDMDHTSTISWKVSIAKYAYDSFRNLKMGNKGDSIENHSDSEFAAIYEATGVDSGHYVSAMYSTTKITNIQDIFASWGAQAGQLHESAFGDIYFLAKKADSWMLIKKYNAGYGSDDRGTASTWNHVVAYLNNDKIFDAGILGEDAQLAIAYDSGTDATKNSYICMHTVMINRVASAKATMHYWDKMGNDLELCTYIADSKANNSVKIRMFAKYITQIQVDGGEYEGVTIDGLNVAANFAYSRAKEPTYYAQLSYLSQLAGDPISKYPSQSIRFFNGIASFESGDTLAIIISVSAVSLATLGLVLFKKHKKQK